MWAEPALVGVSEQAREASCQADGNACPHEEEARSGQVRSAGAQEQALVQVQRATTSRATDCDSAADFHLALDSQAPLQVELESLRWIRYTRLASCHKDRRNSHRLRISCARLGHRCRVKFRIRAAPDSDSSSYRVQIWAPGGSGGCETLRLELSRREASPDFEISEAKLCDADEEAGNRNVTGFFVARQRRMSRTGRCSCRPSAAPVVLHRKRAEFSDNQNSQTNCQMQAAPVDDRLLRQIGAATSLSHLLECRQASLVSTGAERACCSTREVARRTCSHWPCEDDESATASESVSCSGSSLTSSVSSSLSACSLSSRLSKTRSSSSSLSSRCRGRGRCGYSACSSAGTSASSVCTSWDEPSSARLSGKRHRKRGKRARKHLMGSSCELPLDRAFVRPRHLSESRADQGQVREQALRLKCPNCRMSFRSAQPSVVQSSEETPAPAEARICSGEKPNQRADPQEKKDGGEEKPSAAKPPPQQQRPVQLDPKNLLSPMDFVWRGLSAESRALSCTEASLSDDTSSIVAQLAAAARSKSLCTEADSPRLKRLNQQQNQQRGSNLSSKIRGCVGRLTRNAINHIKLLSISNPNIGRRRSGGCGEDEANEDAALQEPNKSNYGAAGKRAGNNKQRRASSLVRSRCRNNQPRNNGQDGMVVTHKLNRFGSSSAANLSLSGSHSRSLSLAKLDADDLQAPYYSPDGIYIGPGGQLSRMQLERQWAGRNGQLQQQTKRQSRAAEAGGTTSWLTRPLRGSGSSKSGSRAPAPAPAQTRTGSCNEPISGHYQAPPQVLIDEIWAGRDNPSLSSSVRAVEDRSNAKKGNHKEESDTNTNHLSEEGSAMANARPNRDGCSPLGATQSNGGRAQKNQSSSPKPWLLNLTQRRHNQNKASPPSSNRSSRKNKQGAGTKGGSHRDPLEACESLRLASSNGRSRAGCKTSFQLSREARSNSLSGPLGSLSQFADLSKSTMELNFSQIAEQTSLYLAELSSRYSGSTHELTPPAAVAKTDHWFSRRSSVKPTGACDQSARSPDALERQHQQGAASGDLGQEDQKREKLPRATSSSGSSRVPELYGANLASICVHCQLIAELANHPASSYLSQLLASGSSSPSAVAADSFEEVAAADQVPSVVLTVCSNQVTVEEVEVEEEEKQVAAKRGDGEECGGDRLARSIDSGAGAEKSAKSSSNKTKLARSGKKAGPTKTKTKARVKASAKKNKKRKGSMKKQKGQRRRRRRSSGSTRSASLVDLSQGETFTTSSSSPSSSSELNEKIGRDQVDESSSSADSLSASSGSSAGEEEDFEDDDEEDVDEEEPVLSSSGSEPELGDGGGNEWHLVARKQKRRSTRRRSRRGSRGKGASVVKGGGGKSTPAELEDEEEEEEEENSKSQCSASMLMVPCNKQARSASLDAPYLLKVPERVDPLLDQSGGGATAKRGSNDLLAPNIDDFATSTAASTTCNDPANYLQPGAKSNRSRSVDISLPTQPGECYLVRQLAAGGNQSDFTSQDPTDEQRKQHQRMLPALSRRGTAMPAGDHMAASEQKKFIQSEIEIPCANGGTRALKLFVNWQDDCINGEHLWLYAGSSSEACYVGENECSKHGPRLCCSACKITAHTGCINILIDKIKFICKHTFKDLTVSNLRHLRELQQQNVIYHHWVHKRTHRGRCRQCTKTFGNTKLPFSSKEIQAITCSWCKVSYHNKENCYTLSALTEPCTLGIHRESIIPSTWILKLPAVNKDLQQVNIPTSQTVNSVQDMDDVSQLQHQQTDHSSETSTAIQSTAFKTMIDCYPKENNENMINRQQPPSNANKKNNHTPLTYGSNATLMTDTSGYISTDGFNALTANNQIRSNSTDCRNNEIIIDPTSLHLADLSVINQSQLISIKDLQPKQQDADIQTQRLQYNHQSQLCDQKSGDNDSEDTSMFLNLQSQQQIHNQNEQSCANSFHNFKIEPQPIQGIPNAGTKPVLVFVNPRSGGNQGAKMMQKFNWLLNPRQVFDLIQSGGPRSALELYRDVPNLRILTIGGDGTASWILSYLDEVGIPNKIPVAVLPLGTGNDLARALGWGGGYTDEPIAKILTQVRDGEIVQLDRWNLQVERNYEAAPSSPNEFSSSSIYTGSNNMELGSPSISSSPSYFGSLSQANNTASTISIIDQTNCDTNMVQSGNNNALSGFNAPDEAGACDRLPMDVINNYFSFGVDAQIALEFHTAREAHPEKFNSRLRNKMFYGQAGGKDLLKRKWKDLSNFVTLYCDGQDMTSRLKELKVHSVLFLNIPSYGGGTRPWPTTTTTFAKPRTDDGLIEVIGLTTYQLPLLQAGGHGTCIAQCRTAKIITSRTIPMQVDGEPCKLLPSIININLKNRVCMLAKSKSSGKSANMTSINVQKS